MGEVYRARDTKLGREVAIKILPEAVASHPERLARFEREAKVLASLNHPNIATLHGFESDAETNFLVMELVDGETLADRLDQGAIPVDEALRYFIEIAEGLESAHDKGVVHRDLKPANIKASDDGHVKILDFGLAKALVPDAASGDAAQSESPTLTHMATQRGEILGTAAYMSPEQARGKPVDKRADVWAFGCCLYEALSGRRPFQGEDAAQTLASVLKDAIDWKKLPDDLAPNVRVLLRRCMERDRRSRLQDIGDARLELVETLTPPETVPPQVSGSVAPAAKRSPWILAAAVLAGIGLGVLLRGMLGSTDAPLAGQLKLSIEVPAELYFQSSIDATNIAISPDGQRLLVLAGRGSKRQVYVRSLSERQFQPVPGTEGAEPTSLFWSPDGNWVGFYRDGELWKVRIEGGVPISIYEGPHVWQPDWADNGWIYFAAGGISGLFRVPESGGEPEVVTELDRDRNEIFHGAPVVLPRAKAVVFSAFVSNYDNYHLETFSFETGERHFLLEEGFWSFYSASGHLVYGHAGTIYAVPFDPVSLELMGPAAPVVTGADTDPSGRLTLFTLSPSGTLVYTKAGQGLHDRRLVWKDRNGGIEPVDLPADRYQQVRLSPDGSHALVTLVKYTEDIEEDILTIDLKRGVATQLTFEGFTNQHAIFSPQGDSIAYASTRAGQSNLFVMPTDGSSPPQQLRQSIRVEEPMSWSPDGRYLVYREMDEIENHNLFALPLHEDKAEPLPLAASPFDESDPALSPDGQWVAYRSVGSGRHEIYVKRFSPQGGDEERLQVSRDGGWQPVWSKNSRELFFRNIDGTALMVVDLGEGEDLELSRPRVLFEEHDMPMPQRWAGWLYDVAPDGRFLMLVEDSSRPTILNVVLNWTEELERLVPAE